LAFGFDIIFLHVYTSFSCIYWLMPMYAFIKFNQAAFRHGKTEADIMRVFETFIYEDPIEDADNKYLLIGFDIMRWYRNRR